MKKNYNERKLEILKLAAGLDYLTPVISYTAQGINTKGKHA